MKLFKYTEMKVTKYIDLEKVLKIEIELPNENKTRVLFHFPDKNLEECFFSEAEVRELTEVLGANVQNRPSCLSGTVYSGYR
ncbi:hypothetical protein GYY_04320 [Methanococcus maripaludis X1]|uniref:Uncharacterized protein n=1 Tax=Methanococcus maripaludis X1 TaxID=1053692 RepID=G0H4V8_METMI|nr:hypothetical protein [Methanococcus maripaludis]AEK19739.1 hypothetical protein GYY_04320 [Methanococcus maripaludis X1]